MDQHSTPDRRDTIVLISIALATLIVHLATGSRYGFHRDELATLHDASHLAFGYVAYPPVTPLFGRLSLELFGTSLAGFRFFAALAEAAAVLLTGLMARELGGGRAAQMVAALAAVPFCLAGGALMQYVSFDYVAWVLAAYFVIRLLKHDDPRWWIAVGCTIGFGILAKYTIFVFAAGIAVGVLLTGARRHFASKWLWFGVAASLAIAMPNLIWQVRHDFVSIAFLRHIHTRDIAQGRTQGFLPDQLRLTFLAIPLFAAGLYFYLFYKPGKRFRTLGWMYLVPLGVLVIVQGRGYYLAPAYPMLYAAGAVWGEQWVASLALRPAAIVRALTVAGLAAGILFIGAVMLPVAPIHSAWWAFASKINGDFREEIGWPELVETVAHIRDALPAQDRAALGILAGNYGEAGAVNLYGARYGLPPVISGVNSFWQRGYGDPEPATVIVIGLSREFVDRNFARCQLAAHAWNRYGIENEETRDHPYLFVCRDLRQSWPEFWKSFRSFG